MKTLNAKRLQKTLEMHADENIARHNMGGAAMLVSQHGVCVCSVYRGYKNVVTQEPLVPRTMFRLASMTKPVTGIACLLGLQNGWFTLDDKVSDHLPAYENMYVGKLDDCGFPVRSHKAQKDILIKHLLTHSSGIISEDAFGNIQNDLIPTGALSSLTDVVQYCPEHTCLSFEPGEKTAYSGYAAFDTLARIIEMKSGQTYATFVQENIFQPLGIKDITFVPNDEQWSRMSVMCDKAVGGFVTVDLGRHTFEQFPLSYTCAGASLVGTIEDYHIFAEMLLQNGSYNGKTIVAPELIRLMKTPYVADGTPGLSKTESWGLGVRVTMCDPILPAGTFGWSGAYGTHFWVDQENDISAVFMKNTRWHDSHGHGETGLQFERDVMSTLQ
ncbi:MAG: serine hydrolase [Bacillota bacterium]|nr:serine hydrolase [Bacillota bacterium]